MEIFFIIIFMSIFGLVAMFAIKNSPEYLNGAHCILDECSHDYVEMEFHGSKCGGTTYYECSKCKKMAYERWSSLD